MTTEPKKEKPTAKMRAYQLEYANNASEESAERSALTIELRSLKSQLEKAVIGLGVGLKIAAEKLERTEAQLKQYEHRSYPNIAIDFNREFGVDYNDLDWSIK